jgi:hypothetical protein
MEARNEDLFGKVNVRLELFDANGNLKSMQEVHNAVQTAGKYGIADQVIASPTLTKPTHCELGTGTGGTTTLNAYISGSRTAFTSKTRANNVVTMVTDFPAGTGTGSVTEAGIFDSATQNGGNMWMYASFTAVTKGANDTLKITWTLTIN